MIVDPRSNSPNDAWNAMMAAGQILRHAGREAKSKKQLAIAKELYNIATMTTVLASLLRTLAVQEWYWSWNYSQNSSLDQPLDEPDEPEGAPW